MKCVDLFSGCGGMSLGFKNAGFDILLSIDNWNKAIDVYRKNFEHPCIEMDIREEDNCIDLIKQFKPDMLIGGPPCQDFSSAGKRDESLGRADLTYSFSNIITKYKPKWFVMENVDRIRKSQILIDISDQFIESGYGLSSVILDASLCGVPQARKRFFLIGELNGNHNALNRILSDNLSDTPMTIRDYLGDSLGLEYYYRHPRNYSRRGIFSIDEPSPTVRGVNRPIPSGYSKHKGDPDSIDIEKLRPLTTIERSYLQTFPKEFIFEGTKTNLEQMIGNAVPVNLANFVARMIKKYIEFGPSIENDLFKDDIFKIPDSALRKTYS